MTKAPPKPPPIEFPKTPERPATVNSELQYRLDFLRFLDHHFCAAEKVQEHVASTTPAWSKAAQWIHEWLLKGARESIDELGPLSSAAQKAELAEFVHSLKWKELA